MTHVEQLGFNASKSKKAIAIASTLEKNNALKFIADALVNNIDHIVEKNKLDLKNAVENNMSAAMQDRLMLNESRIRAISDSVLKLIDLEDVIGRVDYGFTRPNGLKIQKTRVPLGVIGIIFESRPNVTVDAATLCLKAGNAVILRGGKRLLTQTNV